MSVARGEAATIFWKSSPFRYFIVLRKFRKYPALTNAFQEEEKIFLLKKYNFLDF